MCDNMRLTPYKLVLVTTVVALLFFLAKKLQESDSKPSSSKIPASRSDTNNRDHVHVCMAFDENDLLGGIAAINSAHINSRHPVHFHIVTDKTTQSILRPWIEGSSLRNITYEIALFEPGMLDGKIKVRGSRTELANPMNYVRFYYAEYFPALHGKVIHLDSDIIVQADLFDMYSTSLKKGHVAAFSDDCTSSMKRFSENENTYANYLNFNHKAVKDLDVSPSTCSFNVGIYVFDTDLWKQNNITAQLEYWIELNTRENIYGGGKVSGGSQPPMMIAFHNKYTDLDPMWNLRYLGLQPKARYSEHFISHAKLLHWSGPFKPWNGVAQFTRIWDKYYIPDPLGKHEPIRRLKKS